jgi:hypothetical protein
MKNRNLLILLFITITSISSYSQTQKDDLRIGGYGGISITPVIGGRNLATVNLRPEASYFLTNNWMIRSQLSLVASGSSGNTSTGIGLGLGGAYYFGTSKWQPFIGAIVYYGYNSFGYNHIDYSADVGVSYFIKKNIALEFSVPITYIQNVSNDATGFPEYQVLIRPVLGLQVYLRKKE